MPMMGGEYNGDGNNGVIGDGSDGVMLAIVMATMMVADDNDGGG
jgi:hypothetical protein